MAMTSRPPLPSGGGPGGNYGGPPPGAPWGQQQQQQQQIAMAEAQQQQMYQQVESQYRMRLNLDIVMPLNIEEREIMGPRPRAMTYAGWITFYNTRQAELEDAVARFERGERTKAWGPPPPPVPREDRRDLGDVKPPPTYKGKNFDPNYAANRFARRPPPQGGFSSVRYPDNTRPRPSSPRRRRAAGLDGLPHRAVDLIEEFEPDPLNLAVLFRRRPDLRQQADVDDHMEEEEEEAEEEAEEEDMVEEVMVEAEEVEVEDTDLGIAGLQDQEDEDEDDQP